jgi:hypothetical protein
LAVGIIAWHARRESDFAEHARVAFAVTLLCMPIVHYWYLTWILVVLPICPRISWLVLTGSMVIYFEATQRLVETGAWAMPTWAPIAVYAPFILVWIVEGIHRRRMVAVSRPSN